MMSGLEAPAKHALRVPRAEADRCPDIAADRDPRPGPDKNDAVVDTSCASDRAVARATFGFADPSGTDHRPRSVLRQMRAASVATNSARPNHARQREWENFCANGPLPGALRDGPGGLAFPSTRRQRGTKR